MEVVAEDPSTSSKYSKLVYWGKLISFTGGVQAVVQLAGLLSGIFIIRMISPQEYAYYTLANTMLGTMTLLADGGISTGVMTLGGKVWNDREKLGSVLATGLFLRRKFAFGSIGVSIPILAYLLQSQGADWLVILLICSSLIPAFFAALSDSLLEIVPKLTQNVIPLQKNQLLVAMGRLFLTSLGLFLFPWTAVALVGNGIPRIFGNFKLKRIAYKFAQEKQLPNEEIKSNILKIVSRILPGAIYYCLSGQITIWLISFTGDTKAIAEIGALGRLSMILSIFAMIFSTLIVPRFARLPVNRNLLMNKFFQIIISLIIICAGILFVSFIFSKEILWILGENYRNLKNELILSLAAACINLIWGTIFGLYTSRGWIIKPLFSITLSLLGIISGIIIFDISKLTGVLNFNIYVSLSSFAIHGLYALYKINKI